MAVRIVTDSGSDIVDPARSDLVVLPLSIAFGTTLYRDGVDLTHERFYELLVESDELPSTGQVTPAAFSEAFAEAAEAGDEVVAITISAELSGTHESALVAARDFPGVVRVVDSTNVCAGEHILVRYALRLVDQGLTAEQVERELNAVSSRIRVLGLLDTLEYLRRGGRISGVEAGLGTVLSIKPVVTIQDGRVKLLGKARGSKSGRNLLTESIEASGGVDFSMPVMLGYTGLDDRLLRKYVRDSRALWEGHLEEGELPVCSVGATVGTHVGPGAIAVAYFAAAYRPLAPSAPSHLVSSSVPSRPTRAAAPSVASMLPERKPARSHVT